MTKFYLFGILLFFLTFSNGFSQSTFPDGGNSNNTILKKEKTNVSQIQMDSSRILLAGKDYRLKKLDKNSFLISKERRNNNKIKKDNKAIVPVTLHFDITPYYYVNFFNADTAISIYPDTTSTYCELPIGVYEIITQFELTVPGYDTKVFAYVVYENVHISTAFDTTIYSTDAKNKVELATYNEGGVLLTDSMLFGIVGRSDCYMLKFPDNNFNYFGSTIFTNKFYPFEYIKVSDLSNRYQMLTARELESTNGNFYFLKNNPISNGLSKDTLLVNDYHNYVSLEQSFQMSRNSADTGYIVVDELFAVQGSPVVGVEHGAGDLMPYLPGDKVKIYLDNGISELTPQNGFDYFARPCVWEDKPDYMASKKIQSELLILDENRDIMNIGRWYQSFDLALQARNIFPFHALSYNLGNDVSNTLGVEAPVTYCQHLNNFGGMMPNAIFSFYYFLGQYNEFRETDNFYSLLNIKHNGEVVYNDTLSKLVQPVMTDSPGLVEENITNENYTLAGMPGTLNTTLTFDQNNADCDPPLLTTFRILNGGGRITNTLDNNDAASLLLALGDYVLSEDLSHFIYKEGTTATLSYKNYQSDNWIDLPFTEIPESFDSLYGKVYMASLSGILSQVTDSSYFDLKIELTDSTGNTMIQTLHPAFLVNNGGVGISEAGIQNGANFNVYPNPVTNSSIISFILPVSSNVKLSVYNMSGQSVSTLLDKKMDKGNHQINWNTTNYSGEKLSPGIYLLKLETGNTVETTKVIVK